MASPNSRQTFIDYCLRKLGEPVIEINVDPDQIEDKVDDALQKYREFHSDATVRIFLKHEMTADDIANKYVPISDDILYLTRIFPLSPTYANVNMFDIRYQMMLNSLACPRHAGQHCRVNPRVTHGESPHRPHPPVTVAAHEIRAADKRSPAASGFRAIRACA